MKIVIDARCLMGGRRTGVEEYTLGLLNNLFTIDKKNDYILFLSGAKKPRFNFSVFSQYKNVKIKHLKISNKVLNFFFWYLNWPKIDELAGKADVVFIPNIIFGAVSEKTKLVVTIHDLSFERHPEFFSLKRRWWHIFINARKICRRADRIIAVSDSTKNDLVDLYGVPEEKIRTVYNAISKNFKVVDRNSAELVRIKKKYGLPYKFILFLGTIEPRKNISGLIKAYEALQKYAKKNNLEEIEKYNLIITGESGWKNEKIFLEINNSEFKNKIKIINSIPDEDKVYLYNLASLFVYPSFFEGFGFPPLEAMACGTPVIASNNSSLPEIIGEAGILIDPDKPEEIFKAIKEIITKRELRENLIQKSLQKTREFSWQKTAREVLKMFEK
jgi:glycosyltransferase involved in cell wall biosynthesis